MLEYAHLLPARERAAALELLSEEAYYANQPQRAVSARQRALALRRELGEPLATGATLRWLSRIHWLAGDRAGAERAAAEAVEQLEPFPESRELAMALSNRSQLAMLAERNDEALRWGERAIALARRLGDTETLVHAQTNVGMALARQRPRGRPGDARRRREAGDRRGPRRARRPRDAQRRPGCSRTSGRTRARGRCWSAGWPSRASARSTSTLEYLVATRALIDLATGDWDAAVAAAAELVAQPRLANAVARIPALEVVGLVGLRRGQPGAREHLDEAWELARATGELQRLRPIACARAEAAWLEGDARAVDAATRDTLALALEVGHEWDVGELVLWRFRAGLPAAAPESCPLPIACELAGDARGAARHWAALGEPYAEALALLGASDPEPLLDGIALLDRLGATAVAAVRARPAAPRRRHRRPARAASRDAREPGRPDRPPAGGARARDAGTVEPARSRGGCSCRPRPSSTTSRRSWSSSASAPVATSRAPRAGSGSTARAQVRGPERPSWGRLTDACPHGAAVASAHEIETGGGQ